MWFQYCFWPQFPEGEVRTFSEKVLLTQQPATIFLEPPFATGVKNCEMKNLPRRALTDPCVKEHAFESRNKLDDEMNNTMNCLYKHRHSRLHPFPEALIAGVKKGGTSFLMTFLEHNSQIFMPLREPRFFDNTGSKLKSNAVFLSWFSNLDE